MGHDDGWLRLALPLDGPSTVTYLVGHVVPGVERLTVESDERASVERLVPAPPDAPGGPALLEVHLGPGEVVARATDVASGEPWPAGRVRPLLDRWFGLADDLTDVVAHLGADVALAPLLAARPHLRVPGHVDELEVVAQTVLGQQVTLAAARTFTGRLADVLGTVRAHGLTLFPTADQIAAADADELRAVLRVPAARARTLVGLARACADGLDLSPTSPLDPDETRARLLALPGVGPWTADYLALRAQGRRDELPSGDLVLRQALGLDRPRDVAQRALAWSPWRAYAAQHLWTATVVARLTRAASPARRRARSATPRA